MERYCEPPALLICNLLAFRDLLLDNADVFLVCHYPHVFDRTDWHQSIYYQLNEGTADTHHINELLWVIGG